MKKYFSICITTLVIIIIGLSSVFAVENSHRVSLSIVPDDNFPPTVPAGLSATPVSDTEINLAWSASTDDVAVVGYRIFRDGYIIASTTALVYSDTGLTASTTYGYEVEAFDSIPRYSGRSTLVSTTTLETPIVPVIPPVTPGSTGGSSSGGSTSILIDNLYTFPSIRSSVVGFTTNHATQAKIYWGRTMDYELGTISGLFYNTIHAMNIDNLTPGTQYFFKVEVTNIFGKTKTAEGVFTTNTVIAQEILANPSSFKAVPQSSDIALSWRNPTQEMFDGVRVVRSDKFFPRDIYDGVVIYEGRGQSVMDTSVTIGTTYFYTIFSKDSAGNYSSGSLAKARIAPAGEVVIPGTTDPFEGIPILKDVDPIIARLSIMDFDFYQQGRKLVNIGNTIGIDGSKNVTIRLEYTKVPEILKTIAVTLIDPDDPTQVFPFLLRVNKEKTAYEATIAPLGKNGKYLMNIVVLDYKNQGLKKIESSLKAFVFGSVEGGMSDGDGLSYIAIGLFFLIVLMIILVLMWRHRKYKHIEVEHIFSKTT